jgi:hypothetical protein
MAANIPTLQQLYNDIKSNLESELNITIPLFGKNFLRALAAVQAAKLKLYYLAIANVQKNIFVDTADPEAIGGTLERFGLVKLGRLPFTAQPGTYDVTVTGTIGAIILANTTFKSDDSSLSPGKLFVLDNNYTIVAGVNTIQLRALETGLESTLSIGDGLTATAPIANVDSGAVVTAEAITPLAAENIEDYRDKAIEAYQLEPQGGAGADYRLWSKDVQGVQQSYPYAKTGFSNELIIFVEATIADSTDGKGTPPQTMLDNVWDGSVDPATGVIEFDPDITKPLDERGRRPLALFDIDMQPVTINEIDIIITNYQGLNATKQTSIFNATEAGLAEIRPFVDSVDIVANRNDIFSIFIASFIVQQAEPGSIFTAIVVNVDGVPTPSNQFILGNIPHLNSITYV